VANVGQEAGPAFIPKVEANEFSVKVPPCPPCHRSQYFILFFGGGGEAQEKVVAVLLRDGVPEE